MSGTNKNCHVSTKWEDTGGSNSECVANVLLNVDSNNDISLQELIEKELALRSSAATKDVDYQKMLICDMDDPKESELLILNEKLTLENVNNVSRSNSIKSNNRTVTEVDDFDVLYNEEINSADEVITNGHANIIETFETTNHVTSSSTLITTTTTASINEDQRCGTRNQSEFNTNSVDDNGAKVQSPDVNTNSVALDSLENQITGEATLSSLSTTADEDDDRNRVLYNGDTNNVDRSCVAPNSPNNTNLDFVPVSQVSILESDQVVRVSRSSSVEHETFSTYELVSHPQPVAAKDDDDWVCVRDAMTHDEEDAKVSIVDSVVKSDHAAVVDADGDPNTVELECGNHVLIDDASVGSRIGNDGESCKTLENDESSILAIEEHETAEVGKDVAIAECTNNVLSCKIIEQTFSTSVRTSESPNEPTTVLESSKQMVEQIVPQCNGWREDKKSREPDVLVLNMNGDDDYFGYSCETEDKQRSKEDTSRTENLTFEEDLSTHVQVQMVASLEKLAREKTEMKLIEECCYNLTQCNIDVVSESNVAEKKTVKKKKSTSEESVTTTKTKKTKKTKKYEEKENISVNNRLPQNDTDDPNFHQILDDGDELSNVCVRDLKIMYCNEANKAKDNKLSQYEEPVPASVPIKELTRSFGDLRVVSGSEAPSQINGSKSVSMSDLSFMDTRSFLEKKTVRDLATSFENLCLTRSYGSSSAQKKFMDGKSFRDKALVKTLTIRYEALTNETALKSKLRLLNDQKSGFGKFDQLTKKNVMHAHSSDPAKSQQQFSQNDANHDSGSLCRACNKNVFAMEQIKAERHVWHKNCFRCKTCNKQLAVDVYSSHEGELYCKPHFRDLFKPKVVVEEEKPVKFRKPELIIRENQPMDLPPDVVRASDKPDLGLEELSSLNVKSRFQVFEKQPIEENADKSPICVKRSPSILSKLAKFQAKGMDVGVSSDIFNGIDYEESSSSEEEPVQNENVARNSVTKEKPIAFNKMNDVKKNWENGQASRREERQEERRQERQNIRSRLFMGKQNKMREAYENAVAESERCNVKKDVEVKSEKARSIKEKFEKGEVIHNQESDEEQDKKSGTKNDDMDVFEAGISKKSRSIFQQMDAAIKTQSNNSSFSSPPHPTQNGHRSRREVITRQVSNDVVRASDPVEEVTVETADVSSKFKFFETYKAPEVKRKTFRFTPPREGQLKSESPEREISQNPDVVRCEDQVDNESEVLKKSNTTAKMLSLFRQLEEAQEIVPDGLKPMKKFTPPPASSSSSEAESEDESEEPSEASVVLDDVVRACDKTEDEYLKMAQNAVKAKSLKEKFEKWEPEKQATNNAVVNLLDSEQASLDTTKSLRARFESLKAEQPSDKPRPKVNRFVDKSLPGYCDTCFKKVYPLEKVEAGDKVFHRSCFKCTRCSGILRMETFTMNNGHLYCVPHFKQLFITKGNYDEGFGNDQHKAKWPVHTGVAMINGLH